MNIVDAPVQSFNLANNAAAIIPIAPQPILAADLNVPALIGIKRRIGEM
jgi:hypothetical protein